MERNTNVRTLNNEERNARLQRLKKERQRRMRRRRAFFSLILIGIISFGIISFASNLVKESNNRLDKILEDYKTVEVYVKKGDTSWSIQSELTPNEDIRELLHYLKVINNKSMGDIRPGEVLIFFEPIN